MNIYPNPTQNTLNIEGIDNGKYSIYNVQGKLVLYGELEESINVSILSEGLYTIKIENEEGVAIKQFVKQ